MTEPFDGINSEVHLRSNRRRFLQGTIATAGALAIPGWLAAACGSDGGAPTEGISVGRTGDPVRGGTVRFGVAGGGSAETLDPTRAAVQADGMRSHMVFEPLVKVDREGAVVTVLAEEIEPTDDEGSEWVIRVLPDVVWHDGKPLTADDVIYTIRFSVESDSFATPVYTGIVPDSLNRIDERTLSFRLSEPNALLLDQLANSYGMVIQDGTENFNQPIGTGMFKFVEWTRGERAVYERNEEYRVHDGPYVDSLESISVDTPEGRINALRSGQVDVITEVPIPNVSQIESDPDLQLLEEPGSTWSGIYMETSTGTPLEDNRVRLALKHLIDRDQVVQNAYQGRARIGNDVPTITDATYPEDLPQREFDPERARALLKEAGHEDLTLELATADVYTGTEAWTTLFASNAREAGINIRLNKVPAGEYFDTTWTKVPFGVTYFGSRTAYGFATETLLPDATQAETRWENERSLELYAEARTTTDPERRDEILTETQRILWEEGGYIIPAFANFINAAANNVLNLPSSPVSLFDRWNLVDVSLEDADA